MRFRPTAHILALTLLILPVAVGAQPAARVPRIGILTLAPTATASPSYDAFREALRELGYVEGKSIVLEFRLAAGNYERLPELAADLARLPVDVIVTDGGDLVAQAASNATKTIPIVMATSGDPVASGLVASLRKPGGNITGFIDRRWAARTITLEDDSSLLSLLVFHRGEGHGQHRGSVAPVGDFDKAWETACEAAGLLAGTKTPGRSDLP